MVAELFLLSPHGPKRLPRPSEVLFGDWSVPLREAFLWRVEHFPEMLFVLVEPSGLPAEGKKQVADWLCKSRECSMAVILTSPWPFPAAAQAQPLRLNKKAEAQRIWEQQSAQVLLYQGAPGPGGAGPSSGKSTSIRRLCRANELDPLQCHLHEGFTAKDFIETEIRSAIFAGQFRQVALHIDLSAYSDFQVAKTFLRNLLLCQVLYDASTGQMVSIPLESTVHVEIGALAGKRDIHALKSYATEELLHSKFPEVPIDQLNLKMIYPILGILGKDCTNEVRNAPLRCGEEAFGEVPALEDDDVELLGVAQSTQATQAPVLAESPAVALRLMHAFLQPHPLEGLGGRKLIDIRPSEVEQLQRLANYGGPELEKLFHDLSPGGFEVDVRRFPDPPNAEGTLQAFASHFGLLVRQEFTKAHEDLILRRVSILAAFMARSRALLLSFGMTYYVGLNSEQRKLFVKTICGYFEEIKAAETSGSVDLPEVLEEEMSLYMEHIDPGPGIAFTKALKENVFAIVVGIECNIPVMIVGMPGTGKTLAVNVATNVLRGDRSIVNEIRRAAEREGTCIITDFDEVLDGFYDLLNLRFQRIQLGDQMNLAATVASGSYSVLTPVHPRFQLVVSIKASDLEQTPLPFLNRFEKFYLTLADVASFKAFDLCHGQISHQMLQNYILQPVRDRLEELVQLIGPASLIGYRAATMDSAILETLQNQEVSEALVKLAATWQDRGSIAARGPRKFESESTGSLPGDLSERQLADIQQQKALSRMRCHGFQNAGSTCYLQACLVLLTLHENLWLGKSDSTISKTLHDIMKRSRLNTVSMEPVMLLEQELKQVGIVAGSALRMKQRLEGQLPPRLLPICLERWSISGSLMQKNQVQLFVPLEGLELPLLAPSQGRLLVESSECWTYNLRSFVVHIGRTLDSGHYVTYWRSQDGWIEINDASERSIDATTAERKAGDAYLLIYELAGYQGVRTLSGHIPGRQETLRQHQLDAVAAIALGAAGRLMNLAPSEAVLSNMKSLPQELLRGYVLRPHTGLGSLLTHMAHMDCVDRGPRCLVFTRDVLGLHDPLQREDAEIQAMPRSRQEAIALLESRRGKGKPLMVLCRLGATNGGDVECTHRGIDQLRRLADDRDVQGLVVVLLLPPWKLHVAACYQAVFMQSWQIFHLDSLDDSESPGLVSSLLERSEERSSPILHHAVSTVPGGSTPATPSGHSFTTPVTTPVTASVTAPIHSSAEHAELYRDLWTAVGYLTPSESLRSFAEEWGGASSCAVNFMPFLGGNIH
eukprot:g25987.t2